MAYQPNYIPTAPGFDVAVVANPIAESSTPGTQSQEVSILQFQNKYEINPKWMTPLSKLVQYDSVLILDDSGSMRDLADPPL